MKLIDFQRTISTMNLKYAPLKALSSPAIALSCSWCPLDLKELRLLVLTLDVTLRGNDPSNCKVSKFYLWSWQCWLHSIYRVSAMCLKCCGISNIQVLVLWSGHHFSGLVYSEDEGTKEGQGLWLCYRLSTKLFEPSSFLNKRKWKKDAS
jgi:hypothetical protein